MIQDHVQKVKNKELDLIAYVKSALKDAHTLNKKHNYFLEICDDLALDQAKNVMKNPKGKLAGVLISVKDCICVKDINSQAASAILDDYKPVFNATVIDKVVKEGGIIIGKTTQDAFGFGGFNLNVGNNFSAPTHPDDSTRVCGGSSGGSAGFTKSFPYAHISIAESTGGSIASPAGFCGVYGLTPTYGLVSRYGLIDYANSLDKIGVMGNSLNDIKEGLLTISGHDPKDQTSITAPESSSKTVKRIGILKEGLDVDDEIKQQFLSVCDQLSIPTKQVSLPLTKKYGLATYYVLALAEASTNLAKYCGMRYGAQEPIKGGYNSHFSKIRTKHFNQESKRRLIIGTFVRQAGYRDKYYMQAQKVRTKIITEYQNLFKEIDVLVSPTTPLVAPTIEDIENMQPLQQYMLDALTVGPNLAGLPHLNHPIGTQNGLPVGMLITSNHFNESKLFKFSEGLAND
tara:strand:+ start:786 stop:2159 length:1374 start_codon:yes stop_codon:yes gene_type:complete